MSKVLLIAAPRPDSNGTAMHMGDGRPPMGLAYISAYVEKFGHETKIIDLYHFGGGHDDEKQKATKASATISHIIKNDTTFDVFGEIEQYKKQVKTGTNPRDIKFDLAEEIITRFHNSKSAQDAKNDFIKRFSNNAIPDVIDEIEIKVSDKGVVLANLLKEIKLVSSTSDAHRMIKQAAVKIDGERVDDGKQILREGFSGVIQIGKRKFARVKLIA